MNNIQEDILIAGKCPIEADGKCPLRRHGKWIIIKSPLSTETVIKCPFCHDEFIGNDVEHYNYCPNCGASIKKGGET